MYKKLLLIISTVYTVHPTAVTQNSQKTTHTEALTAQLLKNVAPENPSEAEKLLITGCTLLNTTQGRFAPKNNSVWQSIVNNKIISDVLPKLTRTKTVFGNIASAKQLTHIDDNIANLENKTKLLTFFEQNDNILQQLQTVVKANVQNEQEFLQACQKIDQFEKLYFKNFGLDQFNDSKTAHNIWTRSNFLLPVTLITAQALNDKMNMEHMFNPTLLQQRIHNFMHSNTNEKLYNIATGSIKSLAEMPSALASIPGHIKNNTIYNKIKTSLQKSTSMQAEHIESVANLGQNGAYALGALIIGKTLHQAYTAYKDNKETFDNIYKQQEILVATSKLIQSMQKVCDIIEQNPELRSLLPEYKDLKEIFDPESTQTSPELKELIASLLSSTFKTDTSYLFSSTGTVVATYHKFIKLHSQLVPYLEKLGAIDMHLGIFELYQELKNHENAPICLAQFIDHETPQINVDSMWHPLLNPDSVVTNSIAMGYNDSNNNLIITGPNAGGKTTFLTGLAINIILAQAFGIACAKSCTITPFTKIHSYLDITTNISEGESLFKAELNRAKDLKQSIMSCKQGEKAFTMIDEIFSGTNQEIASDIGFDFAKLLGNMSHSMAIITTHIPKLTTLDTETNVFNNYKVADAHVANDGSITYPFKLVPGKSTQNIAREMLEAEGVL